MSKELNEPSAPASLVFEVAYFVGADRRPPSPDTIAQVLATVENLRPLSGSGREKIYEYHNRDTEVTANFVVYPPPNSAEVGLSFEMDLPRPTFYALETLPLIVQVARELRLQVKVMEPEFPGDPFNPTVEDLIINWREANQEEIDFLTEQGEEPPCAPGEDLEAMWEYMLLRTDLSRRYGRKSVSVPPVRLFVCRQTGEVFRYVEWERLGPSVLPEAEFVRLISPPSPLKNGAIYSMNALSEALKGCIKESPQPISHRICERPPTADHIAAVARLKADSIRSFKDVEYWEVVDDG